ncbi:hypothetical protein QTP88_002488 [Uroleucon formosanum]
MVIIVCIKGVPKRYRISGRVSKSMRIPFIRPVVDRSEDDLLPAASTLERRSIVQKFGRIFIRSSAVENAPEWKGFQCAQRLQAGDCVRERECVGSVHNGDCSAENEWDR